MLPVQGATAGGPNGRSITVVVPAYDEALVIRDLVRTIVPSLPQGAELLIVDDGSTDETPRIPVVRSRTDVRSSTRMTVFASREIATRQPGTPLIPPPAT